MSRDEQALPALPAPRYLAAIQGIFAVVLVISNIASSKLATVHLLGWTPTFDGGTFLFPLTYIFGDVLTEVYGYARSRRVIWFALAMNVLAALVLALVAWLPAAPGTDAAPFSAIFTFVPRIVLASTTAFFVGEFLNSFVLAKLKLATEGRWLWTRTIGSTLIGQGADTVIFSLIAFAGVIPQDQLISMMVFNYVYKVALEVLLTPVTYGVVGFLKRAERRDTFDRHTNFNPFKLET